MKALLMAGLMAANAGFFSPKKDIVKEETVKEFISLWGLKDHEAALSYISNRMRVISSPDLHKAFEQGIMQWGMTTQGKQFQKALILSVEDQGKNTFKVTWDSYWVKEGKEQPLQHHVHVVHVAEDKTLDYLGSKLPVPFAERHNPRGLHVTKIEEVK